MVQNWVKDSNFILYMLIGFKVAMPIKERDLGRNIAPVMDSIDKWCVTVKRMKTIQVV